MTKLTEYQAQILKWQKQYGAPAYGYRRFDPTELHISCVKCGKLKSKMHRHHIANDFMFACVLPDFYAKRYIEFNKDDVARLCKRCHKLCHIYYDEVTQQLYLEMERFGKGIISYAWAERWKLKYRGAFEKFLSLKNSRLVPKQRTRKYNYARKRK